MGKWRNDCSLFYRFSFQCLVAKKAEEHFLFFVILIFTFNIYFQYIIVILSSFISFLQPRFFQFPHFFFFFRCDSIVNQICPNLFLSYHESWFFLKLLWNFNYFLVWKCIEKSLNKMLFYLQCKIDIHSTKEQKLLLIFYVYVRDIVEGRAKRLNLFKNLKKEFEFGLVKT